MWQAVSFDGFALLVGNRNTFERKPESFYEATRALVAQVAARFDAFDLESFLRDRQPVPSAG